MFKISKNNIVGITLGILCFSVLVINFNLNHTPTEEIILNSPGNLESASYTSDANTIILAHFENALTDSSASGNSVSRSVGNTYTTVLPINDTYSVVLTGSTAGVGWYTTTLMTQVTMEVWVTFSGTITNTLVMEAVESVYHQYKQAQVFIDASGKLCCWDYACNIQYNSSMTLTTGQLYHIQFSFGTAGRYLYLNDQLVAGNANEKTAWFSDITRDFGIGRINTNSGGTSANGKYDEFRVSNVYRVPPQIAPFVSDSDTEILGHFDSNTADSSAHSNTAFRSNGLTYETIAPIAGTGSAILSGTTAGVGWYTTTLCTQVTMEVRVTLSSVSYDNVIMEAIEPVYHQWSQAAVRIDPNGKLCAWDNAGNNIINGTTTIQTGVMYHILFSFGIYGRYLYLNGNLEVSNSSDTTAWFSDVARDFGIGRINMHWYTAANGQFDEFRVSSVYRNMEDITIGKSNLYTSDSDTQILAYFENNLVDSSSNANTMFRSSGATYDISSSLFGNASVILTGTSAGVGWNTVDCINSVSMEVWVTFTDTLTADSVIMEAIEPVYHQYSQANVRIDANSKLICWDDASKNTYTGKTTITTGVLYHILFQFGPNGRYLYLNDTLEVYNASDTNPWFSDLARDFGIGKINTHWYTAANGKFDEFRVSNVSRAPIFVLPNAPVLSAITPNPNPTGTFTVSWSAVTGAANYTLYRYPTPITSINGSVTVVGTTNGISMQDTGLANGLYYYSAIATNGSGSSGLSNSVSVSVITPFTPAPNLNVISPNPTFSPKITLLWDEVSGASMYSVYRSTNVISSLNGAQWIGNTTSISFVDNLTTIGIYYYVITAYSVNGTSAISNCQSVEYQLDSFYIPPVTNGVWLNISNGTKEINLTDANLIVRAKVLIICASQISIRLCYNGSINPTPTSLANAREFYSIEVNNPSLGGVSIQLKFLYSRAGLEDADENKLALMRHTNNVWYDANGGLNINDHQMVVNWDGVIRDYGIIKTTDSSPFESPSIPGYPIMELCAIAIFAYLVVYGKIKSRKSH